MGRRRFLVLIGPCYVDSPYFSPIKVAIWDVYRVKRELMILYGILESDVVIFSDVNGHNYPTAYAIMKTIYKISELMNPNDSLLCFFSGHGATLSDQMRHMGNRCICLPDLTCLTDHQLRDISHSLPSDKNLTWVIDCCYSGGLINGLPFQFCGSKFDEPTQNNLEVKSDNSNIVLISSCMKTELSLFFNNVIGSVFTFAWLQILRKANGSVHHNILVYNINKALMEIRDKNHSSGGIRFIGQRQHAALFCGDVRVFTDFFGGRDEA